MSDYRNDIKEIEESVRGCIEEIEIENYNQESVASCTGENFLKFVLKV